MASGLITASVCCRGKKKLISRWASSRLALPWSWLMGSFPTANCALRLMEEGHTLLHLQLELDCSVPAAVEASVLIAQIKDFLFLFQVCIFNLSDIVWSFSFLYLTFQYLKWIYENPFQMGVWFNFLGFSAYITFPHIRTTNWFNISKKPGWKLHTVKEHRTKNIDLKFHLMLWFCC